VLVALSVAAIVVSLANSPPELVTQLRLAAATTAAAPSFVLTDTGTVSSALPGVPAATERRLANTIVVRIVYQAPDRVEDRRTAADGTLTNVVIGSTSFRRSGARWYQFPPRPSLGLSAARVVLYPLRVAAGATVVARRGGVDTFLPANLDQVTMTLLGSHVAQLSSVSVSAVVDGDHVARESVTAVRGSERLSLDLAYTSIGTAPPVVAPPASAVVQVPVPGQGR
jgi:hypothetical protein